jgi:hypothetical protein
MTTFYETIVSPTYEFINFDGYRKSCLPSLLHLFLNQKLRLGARVAARFAKAPVGILISLSETKDFSAKRGGRPPASARPHGKTAASWFREARRCPRAPGALGIS